MGEAVSWYCPPAHLILAWSHAVRLPLDTKSACSDSLSVAFAPDFRTPLRLELLLDFHDARFRTIFKCVCSFSNKRCEVAFDLFISWEQYLREFFFESTGGVVPQSGS